MENANEDFGIGCDTFVIQQYPFNQIRIYNMCTVQHEIFSNDRLPRKPALWLT